MNYAYPRRSMDAWFTGSEGRIGSNDRAPLEGVGPERLLAGKRILIVEDEALVGLDMQFAFEDEGAEVIGPALSLQDAMEIVAREHRIDGAVLDVDLGGEDVFPVAQMLRELGVPFVFHTGHGSRANLSQMFPGSLTCSKPTLPGTLIATLLRLVH